jgi:hypothetical protein
MSYRISSILHPTLLIAETIPVTAIRALPDNPVARHSPYILIHARLAHTETAATTPAKRHI